MNRLQAQVRGAQVRLDIRDVVRDNAAALRPPARKAQAAPKEVTR
jgi:hypothetical protein